MLPILSAAVTVLAIVLALEKYPHDLPRKPAQPQAPPSLSGKWAPSDDLEQIGEFIAKGKLNSVETVFLKDRIGCGSLHGTDVSFAISQFIFPLETQMRLWTTMSF